jgi:hypothetical protein
MKIEFTVDTVCFELLTRRLKYDGLVLKQGEKKEKCRRKVNAEEGVELRM